MHLHLHRISNNIFPRKYKHIRFHWVKKDQGHFFTSFQFWTFFFFFCKLSVVAASPSSCPAFTISYLPLQSSGCPRCPEPCPRPPLAWLHKGRLERVSAPELLTPNPSAMVFPRAFLTKTSLYKEMGCLLVLIPTEPGWPHKFPTAPTTLARWH